MSVPQHTVPSNPSWKVVYVAPRTEKKVAKRLQDSGIENYVPIKREKRKWSDRMKWVDLPLINGYVFVKPKLNQRDAVLQHPGVLSYVRYNGGDALIRDREMEALLSIESKGYFVEGIEKHVEIGDEVVIQHGPFKGLEGVIRESSNGKMVTIHIKSLDLALKVIVPAEIVEKQNSNVSHH